MGKHGQLIMGPAGVGKSTYCKIMSEHFEVSKRKVNVVNLDPAAEKFDYPLLADIRDLISVDDASELLKLGPNGSLVFCMEYLVENIDWLLDSIGNYEDDYILFDCPGQIELYSHYPVMRQIIDQIKNLGYNICAVYLLDSLFMTESAKFLAGSLACLSAMIRLELPHVNILTKCDLVSNKEEIEKFAEMDIDTILQDLNKSKNEKFVSLNEELCDLIRNFSLVAYVPLNIKDEESIETVLAIIDQSIQYGEDLEPEIKDFE